MSSNAAVSLLAAAYKRALLGCDWGSTVWLPDDREMCFNVADRWIVLHDGDREMCVKVCTAHGAAMERETDPHDQSEPAGVEP